MSGVATAIVAGSLISGYYGNKAAQAQADALARSEGISVAENRRQFNLARQDTAPWRQGGVNALNYLSSMFGLDMYDPQTSQQEETSGGNINMLAGEMSMHEKMSGGVRRNPEEGEPLEGEFIPQEEGEPLEGEFIPQTEFDAPFELYEEFEPGEFEESPGYQFRLEEGTEGMQNYLASSGMRLSGRALKEMERFRQGTASDEYGNFFSRQLTQYQQKQQDKQNYISRLFGIAGLGQGAVNTAVGAGSNYASNVSNTAMNYGNQMANVQGQRYSNMNNAVQGGMSNWMAYQQQQNQNQA